ncbi:hypothetical protein DLAC_09801 [Tieghemostelium lacteum]|uniref:Carrier domain-containing protein n=1 Tax=Tieghemostelium lacteum TaxID=361077 RepID=A0A151Z7B2_TIELA|nr:hypothetical protein DLAC_09801 [Tieghemostelium lacteum]|eukprot:KYQ89825.1 hypothetical protein DLAC_09801 [Tieghemostelium lacteum]
MLAAIKNKLGFGLKKVEPPVEVKHLKEGVVIFHCDGCGAQIEENFATRYSCSECVSFDLCLECYYNEEAYYQNLKTPGSNTRVLPENYKPPVHKDTAPLPHFMTLEKKNQYLLVYELKGETVFESIKKSFEYFKDRRCLGWRKQVPVSEEWPLGLGDFEWLNYAQFHQMTMDLATAFSHYIQPKQLIGIYMDNCIEWYASDFAALWCSMATVPLHHTSTYSNLLEILVNSECALIVCSKATLVNLIILFQNEDSCKQLEKFIKLIVIRESNYDKEACKVIPQCVAVKSYEEIMEFGKASKPAFTFTPRKPDDISCISYTSGSTGTPKGVVHYDKFFNNHLIRSFVKYPTVILSFATLAHSQRLSDWKYLYQGGRIGIYSGTYDYLFDDLKLLRVHSLWGVPRFWNFLYSQFQADLLEETKKNLLLDEELRIPEDTLYSMVLVKFHNMFGGRVRTLVTGGAPTSPEVKEFMNKCWPNSMVSDSYGLTEAIGIMVDGYISDEVQFRLDPVPEFQYYPTDKPYPRGELVVKTDTMSSGYYKNDELTQQSFNDGWFKTGDVVELVGARKIRIIDRKKNAFKLANGEFVTPEPLENLFLGSPLINQIFIYGNINKQFLVGILKPSDNLLDKVRSDPKYTEQLEMEMCRIHLIKEINEIAKQKNLPNYEIPKIIAVDSTKWTQANGLITGSGKYSRSKLAEYYKTQIDEMYVQIEQIQLELRKQDRTGAIQQYIRSVLNIDPKLDIDLSQLSFTQIGGDSLGAVKLSNILKEQENIDISPSLILNQNVNLSNLSKVLENPKPNNNKNNSKTETQSVPKKLDYEFEQLVNVDWDKEFELDEDIVPLNDKEFRTKPMIEKLQGNVILLTGCTGYLGLNILYSLVKLSGGFVGKVYCLVRNVESEEKGMEQLLQLLKKQKLEVEESIFRSCVVPLVGDLSKPLIGLTPERFSQLTNQVDIILHNGAIVNMVLPYPNMKATNVQSTKDLLKLAVSSTPTRGAMKFIYVSTIGVFISKLTPVINEFTVPSRDYIQFSSGYNQSKLVSDELVREAANRGLPVMIFRPGTIYCHTESGIDNPLDFVGFIVKSILQTKTYPKVHSDQGGHFNLSPVNWVSDSIVNLMKTKDYWYMENQNPQIFHMVNENSLHIEKLCEYIQSVVPLKQMSLSEWKTLQFSQEQNILAPVQHLLEKSDRLPGFENFTCPRTKKYLLQIGKQECLRINKDLVVKNANYLLSK